MTALAPVCLAFAAFGAALIHLAVGASATAPLAVILVGLGVAELGWGALVLLRNRVVAARTTLALTLAPVLVWGGIAGMGDGLGLAPETLGLPFFPLAVASVFTLAIAAGVALDRRSIGRPLPQTAGHGRRYLLGLVSAGVIVAGLTTPALAATEAGGQAVPHGSHPAHQPAPPNSEDESHSH